MNKKLELTPDELALTRIGIKRYHAEVERYLDITHNAAFKTKPQEREKFINHARDLESVMKKLGDK